MKTIKKSMLYALMLLIFGACSVITPSTAHARHGGGRGFRTRGYRGYGRRGRPVSWGPRRGYRRYYSPRGYYRRPRRRTRVYYGVGPYWGYYGWPYYYDRGFYGGGLGIGFYI